jgi:hypothetical protein
MGLNLDGAHQLLAYTNDVNLLGDNIGTVKRMEKLQLMLVGRLFWK